MQYNVGTANVISGSAVVTGVGTAWSANIDPADLFTIIDDAVSYEISSVDSNTQVTLTANYAGASASGADYTICRDFTANRGYPEIWKGDLDWTKFYRRLVARLDADVYRKIVKSVSLDLSASASLAVVLHCEKVCTLIKATLLYSEATSSDAGVSIKIGKETDDSYYYTGTSEISKALWYSKDVTLLQTDLAAGNTVIISTAGGKVGTGEIMLVLEYGIDYPA